jgi:hypothetical protein
MLLLGRGPPAIGFDEMPALIAAERHKAAVIPHRAVFVLASDQEVSTEAATSSCDDKRIGSPCEFREE